MGVVILQLDSSIGESVNVRGWDWAAMIAHISVPLIIS